MQILNIKAFGINVVRCCDPKSVVDWSQPKLSHWYCRKCGKHLYRGLVYNKDGWMTLILKRRSNG